MSRGISRRELLKLAGVGLAVAAGSQAIEWASRKPTNEIIESVEKNHQVKIHNGLAQFMNDRGGFIDSEGKFNDTLNHVFREIRKYPPGMLNKCGIKDIYLADGLGVGGHAYPEQNAVLIPGSLDVFSRIFASVGDVTNHEFYHNIDNLEGGHDLEDDIWHEFHEDAECSPYSSDVYPSEEDLPSCGGAFYEHPMQANWWASEDRAFWAMKIMNPIDHRLLIGKIENTRDPILKEVRMKKFKFIKNAYFEYSDGRMNEQYWDDLINLKVGEGYFR